MNKTILPLIATLLAILAAAPAQAETYHKWVDENGVTHYGLKPPEDSRSEEVQTYNSASSDQAEEVDRLEETRKERANEEARKKKEAEESKREDENPEEVTKERCETHRANLKTLQDRPVVRSKDPVTGEEKVLTDEERQQMLDKTKAALDKCEKL